MPEECFDICECCGNSFYDDYVYSCAECGRSICADCAVGSREEMMKQRRKDLEDIKQASHQIKDLTNVMKTTAQEQGENLNSIENHIMEVQDNVEKANQEMVKANELSKKNRNKAIWLILIIVFVCIVIGGLIVYLRLL